MSPLLPRFTPPKFTPATALFIALIAPVAARIFVLALQAGGSK